MRLGASKKGGLNEFREGLSLKDRDLLHRGDGTDQGGNILHLAWDGTIPPLPASVVVSTNSSAPKSSRRAGRQQ